MMLYTQAKSTTTMDGTVERIVVQSNGIVSDASFGDLASSLGLSEATIQVCRIEICSSDKFVENRSNNWSTTSLPSAAISYLGVSTRAFKTWASRI